MVRSRLAKEAAAREAAEEAAREALARQESLQASALRSEAEAKQLRRQVVEQAEQLSFREEVCSDLQAQLQQQRVVSQQRLNEERLKRITTERLECVLPR